MELLKVEHVSKHYAAHTALNDVSVEVQRGRIFGLLGPNGAGKTSLIRIINCITAPDEGQVFFDGELLRPKHIESIGYLPEERGLYRKMKVGEQAIYLARLKGLSKADAKARLEEWFEKFDIMPWWDKKVEELSKGMQQKVQFVCTVLHKPELLIFDEPFSGFDPVNAELLKQEILSLKQAGHTIIFSTHNMQSVEEVCDDIALINSSRVVLSGKVNDIRMAHAGKIISVRVMGDVLLERLSHMHLDSCHSDGQYTLLRVSLREGETLRDVIDQLPVDLLLVQVEQEIPSMHEIFLKTVSHHE